MHFSERQKHLPPNFMMENLFQDLYGVDAPLPIGKLTALPEAHAITGLKGASRQEGMEGDYGRKLQKRKAMEKLKGNGKGKKTGKGNNAN